MAHDVAQIMIHHKSSLHNPIKNMNENLPVYDIVAFYNYSAVKIRPK